MGDGTVVNEHHIALLVVEVTAVAPHDVAHMLDFTLGNLIAIGKLNVRRQVAGGHEGHLKEDDEGRKEL